MKKRLFFITALAMLLLSFTVYAEYSIEWSITECPPSTKCPGTTNSMCTATTSQVCCSSTGKKSGALAASDIGISGKITEDQAKQAAEKLYDSLYNKCKGYGTIKKKWITRTGVQCGFKSGVSISCYVQTISDSYNRAVCICNITANGVLGSFYCHWPCNKGTWELTDSTAPRTSISVSARSGNDVSFELKCVDADSGCKSTFFKIVDAAASCGAVGSADFQQAKTGTVTCNSISSCGKKVCYYSVDNVENFEAMKASAPYLESYIANCTTDLPLKLVCDSYSTIDCVIRQGNCNANEGKILQLSSQDEDQVVALPTEIVTGYTHSLCCSNDSKPLAANVQSSGNQAQFVISLSANKDARVAYNNPFSTKLYFPSSISCHLEASGPTQQPITFTGKTFGKDVPNPYKIDGHGYVCYYDGLPKVAECCGGNSLNPNGHCNSTKTISAGNTVTFGGVRKKAGQNIVHNISGVQEKFYYCTSNYSMTTDLDIYDNYSCDHSINPNAQFSWTGHYCCSEADDKEEFYYDKGGKGICYNKTYFANNDASSFPMTYKGHQFRELFIANGTIQGCAIDEAHAGANHADYVKDPNKPYNGSFSISNDWLHNLSNYPDSKQNKNGDSAKPRLIRDNSYCATVGPPGAPKQFFCSYLEIWKNGEGKNRTHLRYINWTPDEKTTQRAECCEPSQCWNGTQCVDSFHNNAGKQPIDVNGLKLRCMNGAWDQTPKKYNWNKKLSGYCPLQSQCLADPQGNYQNNGFSKKYGNEASHTINPQCINNTQYIEDHYCDNGNWTTRTKYLIAKMLGYAGGDSFTLFCDNYQISTNQYDYSLHVNNQGSGSYTHANPVCRSSAGVGQDSISKIYFDNGRDNNNCKTNCTGGLGPIDCANNFCVMHVYGTTPLTIIGTTLNQPINSQYYPFTDVLGTACSITATDNSYHSCGNGKVWYNPKMQSVIFSTQSIPLGAGAGPLSTLQYWIDTIINYLTGANKLDQYPFITRNPQVQRLYLDSHGNKKVFAILEENVYVENNPNTYLYLAYEGFSTNICSAFNASYNLENPANKYTCESSGNTYKLVAETGSPIIGIWQEYTTKLRVKG